MASLTRDTLNPILDTAAHSVSAEYDLEYRYIWAFIVVVAPL